MALSEGFARPFGGNYDLVTSECHLPGEPGCTMNLAAIVEGHPAGAIALRHAGTSVTYGELRQRAARVRAGLAVRGVGPGERVALLLPTTPDFVVAYLGVLGAGAVAVPLNPESPLPELEVELGQVRPSLLLVAADAGDSPVAAAGSPLEERATVAELESTGTRSGPGDVAGAGDVAGPGGVAGAAGPTAGGAAGELVEVEQAEPAVFLFTSGTAGAPKAAILTHGNLLSNIEQVELRVGLAVTADDVGVLVVPPFHILGLNAVLGVQLYAGGTLVLVERFDPASLLRTIRDEQVTVLVGVPQLFSALLAEPSARGDELTAVRLACSGAAALGAGVAEAFEARFGVRIQQGYGLTEASPTVTFPDLEGAWRPETVGVPLPGVEVRIVDPDGVEVEPGDPGEVLVRGPNVFAGYFEDPAASSAAVDSAGWLHTGDVAVMDDEGCLTLVDRAKDLIIVSGFNVFPAEVEVVLRDHPAVSDAAVVGVPDAERGEAVKAFVVPAGEPPDEAEIVDFCARRLARYKCPTSVSIVKELPRGLAGKLLRRSVG